MAKARKAPKVHMPTAAEDAKIRRGIAADPDTWEIPANAKAIKRGPGRPAGSNKTATSIMLDNDVIAALKTPEPKGWQTRANAALRVALGLDGTPASERKSKKAG